MKIFPALRYLPALLTGEPAAALVHVNREKESRNFFGRFWYGILFLQFPFFLRGCEFPLISVPP
jgi:hypothetical protein